MKSQNPTIAKALGKLWLRARSTRHGECGEPEDWAFNRAREEWAAGRATEDELLPAAEEYLKFYEAAG